MKIIQIHLDAGTGNCQKICGDVGDKNPFRVSDLCPAPAKSHLSLHLLLSHPLSLALRSEVSPTAARLMEGLENPTLTVVSQLLDYRGLGGVLACWKTLVSMLLLQMWSLGRSGLHSSLAAALGTLGRVWGGRLKRDRALTG